MSTPEDIVKALHEYRDERFDKLLRDLVDKNIWDDTWYVDNQEES